MKHSITKHYDNLKAAHRQWRHPGHCSYVHGENWAFDITFTCDTLDHQNFVVDFGDLRELRDTLDSLFDHTLLIDTDDPERTFFKDMHDKGLAVVQFVNSCGAEGLSKLVYEIAERFIVRHTSGRVRVESVVCYEDNKNSATYTVK